MERKLYGLGRTAVFLASCAIGWGIVIILALAIMALLTIVKAEAQTACGPLPEVRKLLQDKFNQVEVGGGFVNEKTVLIVYASPNGETWTIVNVRTDGQACVAGGGKDWFQADMLRGEPA